MSGQREIIEENLVRQELEEQVVPLRQELKVVNQVNQFARTEGVQGFLKGVRQNSVDSIKRLIMLLDNNNASLENYITDVAKLRSDVDMLRRFEDSIGLENDLEKTLEEILEQVR